VGDLRLSQLAAGPLSIARASSNWRMASYGDAPQSALIEAAGIVWGQQRADNVRAEMHGTLAEHRIEVSGAMPVLPPQAMEQMLGLQGQSGTRALMTAQAGWTPEGVGAGRYRARIERLLVGSWDGSAGSGPPASGWAEARDLKAEAQFAEHRLVSLQADAGRVRVGDSLGMKWDEVRMDLRSAEPLIQLRADIEPFALAPLLARMQPTVGWGGELKLKAHIDVRAAEKMDAEVVFERHDGDLHITNPEGTQQMGLSELRLAVTAHEGLWNFTPVLRGKSIGEVSGRVKVQSTPERRWPQAEAPIEGEVVLSVADVGIWSAWVPPGWRLGGSVRGMATIAGTFGAPQYIGNVTARGLALRNLLQGVNFSDGDVAIKLQGETAEIERFTVKGGDGRLTLTGGATFGKNPQARVKVSAERFRVLGRVDRLVVASGSTDIDLGAERGKITGRFALDEMLYDASRRDAPSLDEDVVVRRPGEAQFQAADAGAGKPRYVLDVVVDIDMGQKAVFRGWGLDTGLRGQLSLRSPNNRVEVVGTINAVNGKFASYGQKLDIERGIVSFSGNLGNPRLDVLALRPNLDAVRVGVTISGPLQEMRIRLYSEPDMSENDKLAWLMLGRAPDSLGRNELALLQRAAVALLSGDGEAPTDTLMKQLGITDLSLRTGDSEVRETVIGIGKQLSARWYVGYERGVNATTGTWQLIYRAAQRYTLRMQSGLENALDIIWSWRLQTTPADAGMRKSTLVPQ
jgi:translocation and assembly module TamB